jgi:hypothetical protein
MFGRVTFPVTSVQPLPGEELTQIIPFSRREYVMRPNSQPDERTLDLIRALRALWRRTQLSGREDFDRACFLIAGDESTTIERFAGAFFQGAQLFALRRLIFFNTKSDDVSDDEMWLARLLLCLYSEDHTSARYLIALRIAPAGHRRLMFLAQGLASRLCAGNALAEI